MGRDENGCYCVLCVDRGADAVTGIERVVDDVLTYGWHVVMVPEDEHGPGWAFTIGL